MLIKKIDVKSECWDYSNWWYAEQFYFCGKFKYGDCPDNDYVKNVFCVCFWKKANKALLVVFLELALTNSNF